MSFHCHFWSSDATWPRVEAKLRRKAKKTLGLDTQKLTLDLFVPFWTICPQATSADSPRTSQIVVIQGDLSVILAPFTQGVRNYSIGFRDSS